MRNNKFSIAVLLEFCIGIASSVYGLAVADPLFMSVGFTSFAIAVVYHRADGMEQKIEELHERIDRLASKIR